MVKEDLEAPCVVTSLHMTIVSDFSLAGNTTALLGLFKGQALVVLSFEPKRRLGIMRVPKARTGLRRAMELSVVLPRRYQLTGIDLRRRMLENPVLG